MGVEHGVVPYPILFVSVSDRPRLSLAQFRDPNEEVAEYGRRRARSFRATLGRLLTSLGFRSASAPFAGSVLVTSVRNSRLSEAAFRCFGPLGQRENGTGMRLMKCFQKATVLVRSMAA